jgi:hypothetical protein
VSSRLNGLLASNRPYRIMKKAWVAKTITLQKTLKVVHLSSQASICNQNHKDSIAKDCCQINHQRGTTLH